MLGIVSVLTFVYAGFEQLTHLRSWHLRGHGAFEGSQFVWVAAGSLV